jgi:hypothetical protein
VALIFISSSKNPTMRSILILSIFLLALTSTNAQIGTIEDYGTEQKIKKQKEKQKNKPNYEEYILENGFFLDGLIQYGSVNRYDANSSYPARSLQAIGIGFRIGNKWYFGNMNTYRPGIAAVWGRINIIVGENQSGSIYPTVALAPANIGFINAFSFGGKIGLEINVNFGLNLIAHVSGSSLLAGYLLNPNIKFRYKSFAVGLDLTIMAGNNISSNSEQTAISIIGLTIGGKF